jgi:hypothetical protein
MGVMLQVVFLGCDRIPMFQGSMLLPQHGVTTQKTLTLISFLLTFINFYLSELQVTGHK